MRKTTEFYRMKQSDCYYCGIEWATPIGCVQVLDIETDFHKFNLNINDKLVLLNVTAPTIVSYVNKLIKEQNTIYEYKYKGMTGSEYAKATISHTTNCNWHINGVEFKEGDFVTPHEIETIQNSIIEKSILIGNTEHIYLISE